jgi:hypothetical protein
MPPKVDGVKYIMHDGCVYRRLKPRKRPVPTDETRAKRKEYMRAYRAKRATPPREEIVNSEKKVVTDLVE